MSSSVVTGAGWRGGPEAASRAGVSPPDRTASAQEGVGEERAPDFLRGLGSAATRSRSVTRTGLLAAANRTYSLSLLFRNLLPVGLLWER